MATEFTKLALGIFNEKKSKRQRLPVRSPIQIQPQRRIGLRDVAREIPEQTERIFKGVRDLVAGALQFTARTGASAVLTLKQIPALLRGKQPKFEQITAEGRPLFEQVAIETIFGKEPVKDFATRIAEGELATKEFGQQLQRNELASVRRVGETLEKRALGVAGLGLFAISALDFTTGGGSKVAVTTALKNADNIIDVLKILKRIGVSDDIAKSSASKFVQLTDSKLITQGLDKISELQKTTKQIIEKTTKVEAIKPTILKQIPKERKFITSVKKVIPEINVTKIGGQYIPRSTDELAIKAKNLIKDNIDVAETKVFKETGDEAVATASELIKHYGDIGRHDDAARIAVDMAKKLTEQGRSIQAASILGRMTPEGQLRFAAKEIQSFNKAVEKTKGGLFGLRKKVPELTGEQAKKISDEMKRISKMPDGEDKAIAFHKLQDGISNLVPSPMYKRIINLWKAGLLTGIKTSGLNTFSNLWHGISEIAKDVPAVAIDKAIAVFTGKRTVGLTVRGGVGGLADGWNRGIRYMKTGFDERNIAAKLDYKKVNFGSGKFAKVLKKYEETVFHLMGAEDQPFYYAAKARSLYSQAIAQAKNKKIKSKELQKFLDDLVKNPTDDMLKNALNDAEISVFQNRTLLGDAAKAIQRIPGGEIVVPFGRTPAAVANQLINYSPVGIVKTIVQNIGKGRFDQRAFSQGIGRGLIGVGAMFIGMKLFEKDLISLNFPKTKRERKLWELEGRKSNSFRTPDGKWRSVAVLGPLGFTMIVGGYYSRAMEESGSHIEALTQAGFGAAKSLTEQTFLRGVNQFTTAINNPESYGLNTISRLFASGIPTIISDVARATDPLERRARAKQEGFFAPFIARIPFIRKKLEPRADVLGRPLERAGNALEVMIDPTRPTRIKSGVIIEELRRLFDAGMSATPAEFADKKAFTETLTPEQRTALIERAGGILENKLTNLINSSEYKKLPDDEKMKIVKKFTAKSREIARAEMVQQLVQNLEKEELKTKLSELKEKGFLTKTVFKTWNELFFILPVQ